jgi:hypothetical protein
MRNPLPGNRLVPSVHDASTQRRREPLYGSVVHSLIGITRSVDYQRSAGNRPRNTMTTLRRGAAT